MALRLNWMRLLLILIISFSSIVLEARNCKPNSNVKADVYGFRCKDSIYASCFRTISSLKTIDSSFSILSYIVRLDGAGFDLPAEILNTGANFNEAKKIIKYLRPGIFIEFSCIKAKYSNGQIYILQPLAFRLK